MHELSIIIGNCNFGRDPFNSAKCSNFRKRIVHRGLNRSIRGEILVSWVKSSEWEAKNKGRGGRRAIGRRRERRRGDGKLCFVLIPLPERVFIGKTVLTGLRRFKRWKSKEHEELDEVLVQKRWIRIRIFRGITSPGIF